MSSSKNDDGNFKSLKANRDNREADENWNNPEHGFSSLVVFGEKSHIPKTMISLEDIFLAYYDCRRNKRNSPNAIAFELHYESECIKLYDEIYSRTYKPLPGTAFIVRDPVQREIFASDFRDRVVHHLVIRKIELFLDRILIHDSYSARV